MFEIPKIKDVLLIVLLSLIAWGVTFRKDPEPVKQDRAFENYLLEENKHEKGLRRRITRERNFYKYELQNEDSLFINIDGATRDSLLSDYLSKR